MTRSRILVAGGAALITAALSLLVLATPSQALDPVNPLEGSQGFLVIVAGDTALGSSEIEGAVATGGKLQVAGTFAVATHTIGSYVVHGDSAASALVVGGRVDFGGSTPGSILEVRGGGYAKVGDLTDTYVLDQGGNTRILPSDNYDAAPRVELSAAQPTAAVGPAAPVDFNAIFGTFRTRTQAMAACPNTVTLTDADGHPLARPYAKDTKAFVTLQPDRTNVLDISAADLDSLAVLTFVNQPSATSPLLVNVDTSRVDDVFDWTTPTTAGIQGEQARYVLFNFPTATRVTHVAGSTIEGTVFAPNAELIDNAPADVDGNVVAKSLSMGANAGAGGVVRDFPFAAQLSCYIPPVVPPASLPASASASRSASPSPSVSPSRSPSWSPSTSPSWSPSGSPSWSPSVSPSWSPSMSVSPSTSPSVSPSPPPSVSVSPLPSPSPSSSPPPESPSVAPSDNPPPSSPAADDLSPVPDTGGDVPSAPPAGGPTEPPAGGPTEPPGGGDSGTGDGN